MEQDPDPYRTPDLTGASQEPGEASRWRIPRAGIAAGMTAFLCLAGAGAAFAVGGSGGTSGQATPSSGSGSTPPAQAPGGGRMHGPRGGMPGLGAVLHGVYTARNGSTGFKTMEVQVGAVRPGNSSSSITVKSADGYSQTYAVDPSTVVDSQAGGISSVHSGDNVRVEALQKGNGYTATDIMDSTQIGSSRKGFGFAQPGRQVPPANQPAQ